MTDRITEIEEAIERHDYAAALRIAARLKTIRGNETEVDIIKRGAAALGYPSIYAEMGYDPKSLVAEGVRAVVDLYGPKESPNG